MVDPLETYQEQARQALSDAHDYRKGTGLDDIDDRTAHFLTLTAINLVIAEYQATYDAAMAALPRFDYNLQAKVGRVFTDRLTHYQQLKGEISK